MKRTLISTTLLIAGLLFSFSGHASNQLATAIGGYDTVSYFTEEKAVQGRAKFHHPWNGAVWYFSSEENRDTFKADPVAYAPQYDGYCAWAASQNYKRPGDPLVWQIEDNKLYIKVHEGAQKKWREDVPKHISQANENWMKIAPY